MRPLNERLATAKENYEEACRKEIALENDLELLQPILDKESCSYGSGYSDSSFLYYSLDLRQFEDTIMGPLTDKFNIKWEREIEEDQIRYSTTIPRDSRSIHLTFSAKPTDNCRIIRKFLGTTHKQSQTVEVEVPDIEYIVDCSQAKEAAANPPDSDNLGGE